MIPDRRGFLAGGLALTGLGPDQERDASLRIGVVNVKKCLEKYDRMGEVEGELQTLRERHARESEEIRKKLALLTEKMELLRNAPESYVEAVRLRGHAEYDLKLLQEVAPRRARDLALGHEGRIGVEVRRVVSLVARERKLQIVLRSEEAAPAPEDPARDLLYSEPALDITPLVQAALNDRWKKAVPCPGCKRKVTELPCLDCRKP